MFGAAFSFMAARSGELADGWLSGFTWEWRNVAVLRQEPEYRLGRILHTGVALGFLVILANTLEGSWDRKE
jgi:hypothetical protein